jgi:glycerophosphoryl diester phosphodiesterase
MTANSTARLQRVGSPRGRTFALAAAILLLAGFVAYELTPPEREVRSDWTRHREVAHALGRWQGMAYTNSLEALLNSREKGFRVFEVDLEFTTDGVLVATHGWPDGPKSMAEFRAAARAKGFTPLTFRELLGVFAQWQDSYLILDTKGSSTIMWREAQRLGLAELPDSLERLIPQLYSPFRRDIAETAAFDRVLLTLYRSTAPDWFILRFLRTSGVNVVTASPSRLSQSFLRDLNDLGVRVYTHTIDDPDSTAMLLGRGVHGVYTASLCCLQP